MNEGQNYPTTVVIGASSKPERYAYLAVQRLQSMGLPVVAVGVREGIIGKVSVATNFPQVQKVGAVSVYVGPVNQAMWVNYVMKLNPQWIVLNPGTEDGPIQAEAERLGIPVLEACTLVMLGTGEFERSLKNPPFGGS